MAQLRKICSFALLSLFAASMASAQSGLFFSEYVEGGSFNKCVEIYNNSGADVGLSLVTIQLYSNGTATANSSAALSGTLLAGDVVVVCTPSIADPTPADILSGTVNYNGDDAFELLYDGVTADVIGQIGVDPGTGWGVAPTSTLNSTIRRVADVCQGDTEGSNPFDPSLEWDDFAQDTLDGLGQHTNICTPIPNDA